MPNFESVAPSFYAELDAQGPLLEEYVNGPINDWADSKLYEVCASVLDPNATKWEETTVSRLLAERLKREYDSKSDKYVNDRLQADLCRIMVIARDEGRFEIQILED